MPRRIVTGVDANGKSVFVSDSEAPGTFVPGSGTMYDVWGVDGEFDAPNDGGVPTYEPHIRLQHERALRSLTELPVMSLRYTSLESGAAQLEKLVRSR